VWYRKAISLGGSTDHIVIGRKVHVGLFSQGLI